MAKSTTASMMRLTAEAVRLDRKGKIQLRDFLNEELREQTEKPKLERKKKAAQEEGVKT
jgi:hypothetical protein